MIMTPKQLADLCGFGKLTSCISYEYIDGPSKQGIQAASMDLSAPSYISYEAVRELARAYRDLCARVVAQEVEAKALQQITQEDATAFVGFLYEQDIETIIENHPEAQAVWNALHDIAGVGE